MTMRMRDFSGSPAVKTLPSRAAGAGSIPSQGAKIPHTSWPKNKNIKQKEYCNKFNKDFKMVHIKKILKEEKNKNESQNSYAERRQTKKVHTI